MQTIDSQQLFTVQQVAALIPAFANNHRAVRHLINKGKENGLFQSGTVVRLGSRLFVDKRRFDKWLAMRVMGE